VAANAYLTAYCAALLGWILHKPVVLWIHGPIGSVLALARPGAIRRRLMAWAYSRARALVFVSEHSRQSFHAVFPGVGNERCIVIRNPAPALDLGGSTALIPSADLLFVGRLSVEKRPHLLLEMMEHLPRQRRLNIIGEGPLRLQLETRARELGLVSDDPLCDRVRFLGGMQVSPAVYRSAQLTVLCSVYEGFPLVPLESLAAGVACVSVPIPALQEMLSESAPAWLAADDRPESLAAAVEAVLQVPALERRQQAWSVAQRHNGDEFRKGWTDLLEGITGIRSEPGRALRSIHFVHSGRAYLPEIQAYGAFLESQGHRWRLHRTPASVPIEADVVWWMCGVASRLHAWRLRHSRHVHEYSSASVGLMPRLKDGFKRLWNPVPDYRVFQSDEVRTLMGFSVTTDCCFRDMGIPESFLRLAPSVSPRFDLVYVGETSRLLAFKPALRAMGEAGLTLLLVGSVGPQLERLVRRMPWVHPIGAVRQEDVPLYVVQARAGLNLMPDRRPFQVQTATKVLEYLAQGLPVVSNRYAWIESLAASVGSGKIHWIEDWASPSAWRNQTAELQPMDVDQQVWQKRTWPQVLQDLPVWAALGLSVEQDCR
jgi:glycosyltransferase involved in cell wall biosynthesis